AFAVVSPLRIALSVLGAVALNLILAINHRPGRYLGV
ncbi:MAG: YitT family protein, partial [Betaproteobacteria bacterium]